MKLALKEEKNLLKLIEKISTSNLKEISTITLEESIRKTISIFILGSSLTVILNYWRVLINNLSCNFSIDIYKSLYDCLVMNTESMKSEEKAGVNFLLGYVKGKLNQYNRVTNEEKLTNNQQSQSNFHTFRADGYSNLINSFSNNNKDDY
jgi:hypothetical protein